MLIVAVDSHRQSTVYNRYATLIFTNPVFLGFSRYQNVKFGSQRDRIYNSKRFYGASEKYVTPQNFGSGVFFDINYINPSSASYT